MTSQIFANIYLNEFDRYVRYELKPLAYMRYGDDFILYFKDHSEITEIKRRATTYLSDQLAMRVHVKNNVVVLARHGMHFLGHRIYPRSLTIEPKTQHKIRLSVNHSNITSYQALSLPRGLRHELPWLLDSDP